MSAVVNNARIAKNTLFLYLRTIVSMLISLYTSRAILQILGVDDFGIYQVVGGLVSIFTIVSSSLTTAISRYITFEIGTGNSEKLKKIFATSTIILIVIGVIVIILAECIAGWFIEKKMTVPPEKVVPTVWVLQFTLISFFISLLSMPYNACIIAHEKMKAFAYISLLGVSLRLGACFLLLVIPLNKLVTYSVLLTIISISIRLIYATYCRRHFVESRAKIKFDKELFKEMIGFSGWSFFSNSAYILNNQGITMLVNVYFGLVVNTARGLAFQVEGAVVQFVNNFTTAINPQITKSYAQGEYDSMYKLVCRGAKFSCFIILLAIIPLIFEMKPIMRFWLSNVPEYAVIFSQLCLVLGFFDCMGSSGFTACMATGKLRKYSIIITSIGSLEFILTWIFFHLGSGPTATYWIFIGVKFGVNVARMFLLKSMVGLPVRMYLSKVFSPIFRVILISIIPPIICTFLIEESILRILVTVITSIVATAISIYFLGLSNNERVFILDKFNQFRSKIKHGVTRS